MGLLSEVVGQILFSFTRSVTEHYNPEEPEFTAEFFGYDPLESTGREWYYRGGSRGRVQGVRTLPPLPPR